MRTEDFQFAIFERNLYADAAELAFHGGAKLIDIVWADVGGVWIEFFHHAVNGRFDQFPAIESLARNFARPDRSNRPGVYTTRNRFLGSIVYFRFPGNCLSSAVTAKADRPARNPTSSIITQQRRNIDLLQNDVNYDR